MPIEPIVETLVEPIVEPVIDNSAEILNLLTTLVQSTDEFYRVMICLACLVLGFCFSYAIFTFSKK